MRRTIRAALYGKLAGALAGSRRRIRIPVDRRWSVLVIRLSPSYWKG
ncbi:MAG: hypothetical protein JO359_03530 [Candidatus Eremiobacteraeota bacterium]|nr:hypothetical protein [Candidatus Eremiobacteraeota bacterium]